MDYDDIVIGSGLAALGTVMGLEHSGRVLVLGGPAKGAFSHYDARRTVPSAYLGAGGLGNDWHGVIPTGWQHNFGGGDDTGFVQLFRFFHPRSDPAPRLGQPWLFVPRRPLRPRAVFAQLERLRAGRLVVQFETATNWRSSDRGVEVDTAGRTHGARRLWIAAGALHTPGLLARALGRSLARGLVSDHVGCYVGQADGLDAPQIAHTGDGAFFQAWHADGVDAMYTLRPARFAFRRLDHGVEQRAVFGLPTGSAVAKIARRMSPGLLAEAFFNRYGLFPRAARYSVFAQVLVRDAYTIGADGISLRPRAAAIDAATALARACHPFDGVRLTRRPELTVPGIHLHHTLDLDALSAAGIGLPGSPVQVVDASVLHDIGPEHHSFKMMLAAHDLARSTVGGG